MTWPWSDIVALTYLSSEIRITRKNIVNIGPNDNYHRLGHCIQPDSHSSKHEIKISVCNNTLQKTDIKKKGFFVVCSPCQFTLKLQFTWP